MSVVSVKDTPQNQQFGPIPPGNYYADIEKAVYKPAKNGGMLVALTVGLANNRKLFSNFSVEHSNPDVVSRAMKDIADLLFACNMEDLASWDDVTQFEGKKIMVRIYTRENKDRGEQESAIGSFARYNGEHRNKSVMKLGVNPASPKGAKQKDESDVPF